MGSMEGRMVLGIVCVLQWQAFGGDDKMDLEVTKMLLERGADVNETRALQERLRDGRYGARENASCRPMEGG